MTCRSAVKKKKPAKLMGRLLSYQIVRLFVVLVLVVQAWNSCHLALRDREEVTAILHVVNVDVGTLVVVIVAGVLVEGKIGRASCRERV